MVRRLGKLFFCSEISLIHPILLWQTQKEKINGKKPELNNLLKTCCSEHIEYDTNGGLGDVTS